MRARRVILSIALAVASGHVVVACGDSEPRARTPKPSEIPLPSATASNAPATSAS